MLALLAPPPIADATRGESSTLLGAAGPLAGCGTGPAPGAAEGDCWAAVLIASHGAAA